MRIMRRFIILKNSENRDMSTFVCLYARFYVSLYPSNCPWNTSTLMKGWI